MKILTVKIQIKFSLLVGKTVKGEYKENIVGKKI